MTEVYLTRIDSDRNMARYYRMSVQPTRWRRLNRVWDAVVSST